MDESPGHAKFDQDHPEITPSLRLGDAFHAAILEPERYEREYVVLPKDCSPGSGPGMKARKAAFLEDAEDKKQTVISDNDSKNIKEMSEVVQGDQESLDLLSDGESEKSGYFVDPDYGVLVKFRLDYINLSNWIISDLKSCASAQKLLFRKVAYSHGYDMQAWISLYGTTQITGFRHDEFKFICVENKLDKYHGLQVHYADEEMLEVGRARYCKAMEIYVRCLESGIWDGYDSTPQPLGAPTWVLKEIEEY